MMNVIAFLTGISLPALGGIMALTLLENGRVVLASLERLALGFLLGLTYAMFLVFGVHVLTHLPLTLPLYLGVQILGIAILAFFVQKKHLWAQLWQSAAAEEKTSAPMWLWRVCQLFLAVLTIKIIITSVTFLLFAPTYLDDSLNNWNLRGKLFFEDTAITLVLPNEDPALSPKGVSSYPPAVPLSKAWLANIAGNWNDPLINSIQVMWYLSALSLVFFSIRRHAGLAWAFTGLLMIGGMPLYLMHGTNPYADVFLSAHVFAAVSMLFAALHARNEEDRLTFLRIGAVATAILPFTKNEAMLVYLPPLLLITAVSIWMLRRQMTQRHLMTAVLTYILPFALVCGPWLFYKWVQGLTFGNGKAFTSLGVGWHENVLQAIGINTFFEGNWLLLLPLLFLLLVWRFRAAFSPLLLLSSFFLMIYIGQVCLYLFTDLATEALRQTGYARGLVQLTPIMILLTTLLLRDAFPRVFNDLREQAK